VNQQAVLKAFQNLVRDFSRIRVEYVSQDMEQVS